MLQIIIKQVSYNLKFYFIHAFIYLLQSGPIMVNVTQAIIAPTLINIPI